MNIKKWLKNNTSSLKNKTVAIIGSTGGLGSVLVDYLASLSANFVLCNRNQEKSEMQKQKILLQNPEINVEFVKLDLEDFDSVKTATQKLKQTHFDFLVINSGVYNVKRSTTSLGLDNVFQVNFFSPYYIVNELMKNIKEQNVKVVVVSSIAHNFSIINEKDVQFLQEKKSSKVYGNSKRFLTFSLFELSQKENFCLSVVHPGVTLTNMTNHYPKTTNWLVKIGIKIFFPPPKIAVLSILRGIFDSTHVHEWIGPKIFNVWGTPKKSKLKTATKQESQTIFHIANDLQSKVY